MRSLLYAKSHHNTGGLQKGGRQLTPSQRPYGGGEGN